MPSIIVRFFKKNRSERQLFLLAYFTTTYISFLVALIPKKVILKRIGALRVESDFEISLENQNTADQISKAIRRTVRYTPWRVTCLAQAILAKYLLKRRKIASTLYLGVAKDGQGGLIAHAWLRCGSQIITGKEEMSRFTVVGFFT